MSVLTLRNKVYHSPRLTLTPPPLSGGWGGGTTQTDLWGVCGPSYKVDAAKECFMVNKFPSAKPDRVKNIPYFRPETLKNHIPLACTYLYYPYKAVPCSLARLAPSLVGARCECSLVRRAPSLVGARREKNCGPVAVGASSARSFARDGRQSFSSETS